MKLLIETRNGFYDGWLAEILGIPLPEGVGDTLGVNDAMRTAAEIGPPCLLLEALRAELQQGVPNIKASYLPETEIVEKVLPLVARSVHARSGSDG